MNYDLIKNTLLEIIKEAKNLDNEDLEAVGKTNVLVKKGRAEEFRTRAYEYFEYLNNVLINDNIDYVTEVYNTLDKEISLENNEYYNSKSFDIMNSNSKAVAKLKALKGSIRSIDKSYNILVKDLKRALMLGNTLEQKETLGKINKEIDSLLENKNMLDEEIKNLANIINTKVIDYIKEEMARILQDYRTTTYGTKIAFGLDGKSILAKDKEEYDSLFNLKKLLEEVNKDNVVIVDDFLCINPENEEYVRNLLNNSNVFKRLKREKEQEISDTQVTFENPNEELNDLVTELEAYLDKIAQKISNYRGKSNPEIIVTNKIGDKCWAVLKEDIDEANRIIEIIKILQEPSNNMENVWNIASVSKENIAKFKELVNATHYFENDIPKIDANEAKIKEIKQEIENLMRKAKETKNPVLAPNSYVLASDMQEFNLLNILYSYLVHARAGEDLAEVDGVKIETEFVAKYEETLKELEELKSKRKEELEQPMVDYEETPTSAYEVSWAIPDEVMESKVFEPKNQVYITKINRMLEALNNEVLTDENRNKIKNLKELVEMLSFGITKSPVEHQLKIDDVIISEYDKNDYLWLKEKLENLFRNDTLNLGNNTLNQENDKLNEENTRINDKEEDKKEEDKTEEKALDLVNPVLIKEDTSSPVLNPVKDTEEPKYESLENDNVLENQVQNEENPNYPGETLMPVMEPIDSDYIPIDNPMDVVPRKDNRLKVAVRKLKNSKAIDYIKENKKLIVAIGLCAVASSVIITSLPEVLIFANSCNAIAMPHLAGLFNSISTVLATFNNITFVNGSWIGAGGQIINATAAASKASAATLACIASLTALGGGLTAINKMVKSDDLINKDGAYHLKDNNNSQKILDVVHKIRSKVYNIKTNIADLGTNIKEKIDSTLGREEEYQEVSDIGDPFETEEEVDLDTLLEEAAQQDKPTSAEIEQNINDRTAKLREEFGDLFSDAPVSSVPSLDSTEVLIALSDNYLEGINQTGLDREDLLFKLEDRIKELQQLFYTQGAVYDVYQVRKDLAKLQNNYNAIKSQRTQERGV